MDSPLFSCYVINEVSNRQTILNLNNVIKVKRGSWDDFIKITLSNGEVIEVKGTVERFVSLVSKLTKTNILPL